MCGTIHHSGTGMRRALDCASGRPIVALECGRGARFPLSFGATGRAMRWTRGLRVQEAIQARFPCSHPCITRELNQGGCQPRLETNREAGFSVDRGEASVRGEAPSSPTHAAARGPQARGKHLFQAARLGTSSARPLPTPASEKSAVFLSWFNHHCPPLSPCSSSSLPRVQCAASSAPRPALGCLKFDHLLVRCLLQLRVSWVSQAIPQRQHPLLLTTGLLFTILRQRICTPLRHGPGCSEGEPRQRPRPLDPPGPAIGAY